MNSKIPMVALLCAGTILTAQAQIATSWLPGNGSWSDFAKWTAGVPNSASADAYIDSNTDPVTLAGTGAIVLDGAVDGNPELIDQGSSSVPSISWIFDDVTVRGRY